MHIFDFDNSYARLLPHMFTRQEPAKVPAPKLIALNESLARELGGNLEALKSPEAAEVFAGNTIPDGAEPIAQAYGGHQFGQWNPGLGDGRAVLLGEVVTPAGDRYDLQLKGSGRTPYSRAGDGKAWVGPVIREYIMSEAMHALSVPTTRALAAVTTGETVVREAALPGAVLTRVAQSHIRVGTFQLYAYHQDINGLKALFEHTAERHFGGETNPAVVLRDMMTRQAKLIARWIGLGFIHGVMNTDNMLISGETIDYGPCAFMDAYHPHTVFSSIDHQRRYAYSNQPQIAVWNIAQFASSMIPLMPDQDAAIEEFTGIVNEFADLYQAEWRRIFAAKLGLQPNDASFDLTNRLLTMMAEVGADFTNTFATLGQPLDHPDHADWLRDWFAQTPDLDLAARTNPQVIPRLHHIEAAIASAIYEDYAPFNALLSAATNPFTKNEAYMSPPTEAERVRQTFCGT